MICATFKYPKKLDTDEWVNDTLYLDVERTPVKGEYVRLNKDDPFRYEVSNIEWTSTDSGFPSLHPIVFLSYVG